MTTRPAWDVEPPRIERVYARARRRRGVRVALGTSVASLIGLTWLGTEANQRDRGVGLVEPDVHLEAVVEGGGAPRTVADGDDIGPAERVVFVVRTTTGGEVRILEDGARPVYPPSGTWRIPAGAAPVGGERPLAWTPDDRRGWLTYEATLCVAPGRCATDRLRLRWEP